MLITHQYISDQDVIKLKATPQNIATIATTTTTGGLVVGGGSWRAGVVASSSWRSSGWHQEAVSIELLLATFIHNLIRDNAYSSVLLLLLFVSFLQAKKKIFFWQKKTEKKECFWTISLPAVCCIYSIQRTSGVCSLVATSNNFQAPTRVAFRPCHRVSARTPSGLRATAGPWRCRRGRAQCTWTSSTGTLWAPL